MRTIISSPAYRVYTEWSVETIGATQLFNYYYVKTTHNVFHHAEFKHRFTGDFFSNFGFVQYSLAQEKRTC